MAAMLVGEQQEVYSMKGTLAAMTGLRGSRWLQYEYLKKNGRSSSTGRTSKGYLARNHASFAGSSRERKTWYRLRRAPFSSGEAESSKKG
jgi:hypothetical protein